MPTTTDAGFKLDGSILSLYSSIKSKSLFIPGDFSREITDGEVLSTAF